MRDPAAMTPEQRRRELAGILAAGLLRLLDRPAIPAAPDQHPGPENPPESPGTCLEVVPETVLTVHTG